LDGCIDIDRSDSKKGIVWITQPETQVLVHKWRHEEAAILVGKNTVATDNPSLTCRAFDGNSPVRVVIDKNMRLDYGGFNVGDRSVKTYILTEKEIVSSGQLEFIHVTDFSIASILAVLYDLQIQSVIIEGGKTTLNYFISADLWDEARILTGINALKNGVKAPSVDGEIITSVQVGKDHLNIIRHA